MSAMVPVLLSLLLVLGPAFSQKTQNGRPSVSITSKVGPRNIRTLKCQANNFYPRSINMYWTRGSNVTETDFQNEGLITKDGTYMYWVLVVVPALDRSLYSCHMEHSSLAQPLVVPWNEGQESGDQ
ncbi:zinc-alpha-2-glycoprotein-like isoform X2 [Saccopteryx leptura]|uniref:zinc-alpha-2-glycoprotein-like isoform X2 n=1 Tax=Saccopteryx leptura TaxID=249018 RepID=UPI00339CA8C5